MKKIAIGISSRKAFFDRLLDDARKLDRGETLPAERSIAFENPEDLFKLLTPNRIRLLRTVKDRPIHVTALASRLRRTASAVRRDVAALETAHLVTRRVAINPGHGRTSVVTAVARNLNLVARI